MKQPTWPSARGYFAPLAELDLATGVGARAADGDVLAAATEEPVVARTALEGVVAVAADHLVPTAVHDRADAAPAPELDVLPHVGALDEPAQLLGGPERVVQHQALHRPRGAAAGPPVRADAERAGAQVGV